MSGVKVNKSFLDSSDPITKYVIEHSIRLHPIQEKLMKSTLEHSRSNMMGAPEVLQLNQLLMRTLNAKKVIDVGVFTGMSTLSAALVIPDDGKVIACDVSEEFTNIGKRHWEKAGVIGKISLHLRPAVETLQELLDNGEEGTFDFAFIDADKENYSNYYELCLKLIRKGGIISIDNVLWSGAVADQSVQDSETVAIRRLNDLIASDNRVEMSMLNVGDGLTLAHKK